MKDQRLQEMECLIFEKRHTSLQQLCEHFGISMNTVRRDIEVLSKWGAVDKVYGGVVANPRYRSYLHFGDRSSVHTAEKQRIGRLAATRVKSDEIVMADTGSTVSEFFRHIDVNTSATIITNNLTAYAIFTRLPAIRLVGLGGEFISSANGFAGPETIATLRRFKATKAFISITGLLADDSGITNAQTVENEVKRQMIACAQEVYLLVDSSKFGVVSPVSIATYGEIDYLVTDTSPGKEFEDVLRRNDVTVLVA